MAQIDLKNTTVRIKDGTNKEGAVNNAGKTGAVDNIAGYAIGDSVIAVDTFVGAVAVGDRVVFSGHATEYVITAHVETASNTTSITISPVLTAALTDGEALSTDGYSVGEDTLTIDGFTGIIPVNSLLTFAGHDDAYRVTAHTETAGNTTSITITPALVEGVEDNEVINVGPNYVDVKIGEGNLTYEEKQAFTYTLDRGRLDTVKSGDEAPIDVRMDFTWEELTAATGDPPTVEDALKQEGAAAGWASASDDPCEPYAVDIEVINDPECGEEGTETVFLSEFRWESLNHDMRAGTVAVTGKCNITKAVKTRS
jgi:hypothetical protein